MENFIIYMVKACGIIAVFFLAYNALLKKETFFNSNRWFLLAGLFTAVALPFIVYTKTIWVEPVPLAQMPVRTIDINQLIQYKQHLEKLPPPEETININWFDIIGGMYFAGVLLFFVRFVLDFLSIRKVLTRNIIIKDGKFRLIDSDKVVSPFSFFHYIVYNSAILRPEELESIIAHEKVHSSQKHSLDMIISQLFCVMFWFNPFVWMYKKSISQNLEFIADAEATRLLADKQAYQKTLLKITVQPDCIAITNHFYQSLIKKRIVMLNKQQSKKWNSWKYTTILPLLAAFMFLFQVKVVAQTKQQAPTKVTTANVKLAVEINKDTKDSELEESKQMLKDEFDADVKYENVTRNLNSEITAIKVTVKDKGQSQVYEVMGNDPISPFTIEVEQTASGRNSITFGTGENDNFIKSRAFRIAADDNFKEFAKDMTGDSSNVQSNRIIRSFAMGRVPDAPFPPAAPEGNWSVNSMKIGDTDMLIVINGVKQKKGQTAIKLPLGQEIAEMNILKGKEAKKKYGKEAKEGAVEITTKGSNNMAFNIGPEVFDFHKMPDMQFDMPMDFDIRIEDFPNIQDFMGIMKDGDNVQVWGDLSEEERKQIQEEMKKARIELKELQPKLQKRLKDKEASDDEMREAKKEIEKAKKEIEESRKEMEESRKEMDKARKEMETARKQLNRKA
ncbi:peptidase M56 [Flavobacterium album]|uniref:Peptidase M56 n=1 Tax=Flavobacterium album TaxID=2175091 RepID=A0A2S1QZ34_9FLAO|nr:M56 family metallopeptidase [Flavobacterium album]AWH85683.1 peptidase M56 [Flavobacterium album]